MSDLPRRLVLAGPVALAAAVLGACTDHSAPTVQDGSTGPDATATEVPPEPVLVAAPAPQESRTLSGDAASLAAAVSALLLERARGAILTPEDTDLTAAAADLGSLVRWPVLVGDVTQPLPAATITELRRLGVEQLVQIVPAVTSTASTTTSTTTTPVRPPPLPTTVPDLPGVTITAVAQDEVGQIPHGLPTGEAIGSWPIDILVAADAPAQVAVACATALGPGARTGIVDPREDPAILAALREDPDRLIVGVAGQDVTAERLLVTATMARRAPELPGGGVTCFPHRRMVALYGHPGAPVLGLLGEQGPEGSVRRVNEYVQRYSALVEETVVPAFEIIATVADVHPGPRGDYSLLSSLAHLTPWIDVAAEHGIYVVLDLQPGRTDFLTQAKVYEELLRRPHVGLALDPEWRLKPDQKHLRQIGSVDAAEINAVSDWLAALVREHDLPQKVLTLHQFRLSMIRDRDQVRTDHPELAIVLHADGQGPQGAKQTTWRTLKDGLPEGMWLGWKNFYDEDSPMLTPEQTVARVEPVPWFISYQ